MKKEEKKRKKEKKKILEKNSPYQEISFDTECQMVRKYRRGPQGIGMLIGRSGETEE